MQANHHKSNNSKQLLNKFKDELQRFARDYLKDHEMKCHEKEIEALNRLQNIASDIDRIELNETDLTTADVINELDHIIARLKGIKPPKEWIDRKTSGLIFATTVENKVFISLHDAMESLIKKFERERELLQKTEPENTAIEKLRQEMDSLNQKLENSVTKAYQEGKLAGATEFKQELTIRIQKQLPSTLQKGILMLLEGKEPLLPLAYPSANASEAQPEPSLKIKTEEDEKEKAKAFMGEAKFLVAQEFMQHFNNLLPQEKLVAKLLIFQLMAHKNDKTIHEIISSSKK